MTVRVVCHTDWVHVRASNTRSQESKFHWSF